MYEGPQGLLRDGAEPAPKHASKGAAVLGKYETKLSEYSTRSSWETKFSRYISRYLENDEETQAGSRLLS